MKTFLLLSVLSTIFLLCGASGNVKRYDGYKVYKVTVKDQHGFQALKKLQETTLVYDFWTEPSMSESTDIMVPPDYVPKFIQLLDDIQATFSVKVQDVQSLIDESHHAAPVIPHETRHRSGLSSRYAHNWNNYSSYATINEFILELAASYPSLVTVTSIGKSIEGRDTLMMKVSTGSSPTKKAIFIDGGIHAREWISPATVTWLISELVENNNNHPDLTRNLDWYFVPLINPDGYEYTQTDRLWRKNRRLNDGSTCIGVDLNRNGCFHWAEGGTSPLPCSDIYHGTACSSEIEIQNLGKVIEEAAANRAKAYLTFHSYGQNMVSPWSYRTNNPYPDNYPAMLDLANRATAALKTVYGTSYGTGNSVDIYGPTAGSTDDWSKGIFNIPFAYTVELRDKGEDGFVLPPSQIIPTATEAWELVKVVANEVITNIPL